MAMIRPLTNSEPDVYWIDNFLTKEECTKLIRLCESSQGLFQQSSVGDGEDQKQETHVRSSQTMNLQRGQTKLIQSIEERVAKLVELDRQHIEPIQVVKYSYGQQFTKHHDAGTILNPTEKDPDKLRLRLVDPARMYSMFVYLNDLPESEKGGRTLFSFTSPPLAIKPVMGSAVFWSNLTVSKTQKDVPECEPKMIHAGEKILYPDTIKWGMNIWICCHPIEVV